MGAYGRERAAAREERVEREQERLQEGRPRGDLGPGPRAGR